MINFLLKKNPTLSSRLDYLRNLIDFYVSEAQYEGVNYEIAFAQMCYHTNYLSFYGTFTTAESNNFFGLASLNATERAYNFSSIEEGVRAHIQHLKGYATAEPLKKNCVDPRYNQIAVNFGFGISPTINGLSNRWAGSDYSNKLKTILDAIYANYKRDAQGDRHEIGNA